MSGNASSQSFLSRYVFSLDHRVIGLQYLFTAMALALVGGLLALIVRIQIAWPDHDFGLISALLPQGFDEGVMKPEFYAALFTMHGTIMIFFVLSAALIGGFGNYLIPLQVGAKDMAFPRLNALSYWIYAVSSVIMLSSFVVPSGPAASGWTAYPPLSALKGAIPGSNLGQDLWLVAMALFIVSFTLGGLNFLATILALRKPELSMMDLPLFTWSMLFVAILGLLAFPSLTAASVMLLLDRHAGTSFFIPMGLVLSGDPVPGGGGSPILWQHLFWFLGHPEVYILMLPSLGITSDLFTVFTGRRVFGYRSMVIAMALISGMSFLVWGHHMFVSGMSPFLGSAFAVTTTLIAVPSGVKVFNWIATLWNRPLQLTTPMLWALGIFSLFVTGGLSGIWLGQTQIDIQLHDTAFVVGHFHIIMAGAALFGVFAGLHYWFPLFFGRLMSERLGAAHFLLTFVFYYATFFPMHLAGLRGQVRRVYDPYQYEYLKPLQSMNAFITWAAVALALAQILFFINFFWSLKRGAPSGAHPWAAESLEWTEPESLAEGV
ncbi:MAG: cbb3-type cytochrome c oxidase subunit I [Vicinamibacteria bacterium]|nr:cbb3-type cytochrome c oxidase subunit I [Vicinamibacteria bacterium]